MQHTYHLKYHPLFSQLSYTFSAFSNGKYAILMRGTNANNNTSSWKWKVNAAAISLEMSYIARNAVATNCMRDLLRGKIYNAIADL